MYAVLVGILLSQSVLTAQEAKPATVPPPPASGNKPIVVKWVVLGGMNYYQSGLNVSDNKSLEAIIDSLNDAKATQLLKKSESSHDAAVVWLVGGGVFFVGGLVTVFVDPNTNSTYNSIDTQQVVGLSGMLVGLVGGYVGAFKFADSQTEKFAAVQQYNAVVHGDDLSSYNFRQPGFKTELLAFRF